MKTFQSGSLVIVSDASVSEEQLRRLLEIVERAPDASTGGLLGRNTPFRGIVEGVGNVVVKSYRRGGWIRIFWRRHYLRLGKYRCQHEYEMYREADRHGVCVPEPVAFAYSGNRVYRAWLVTREIPGAKPLAGIAVEQPDRIAGLMDSVVSQIRQLIEQRIRHDDLHPGNILVGNGDRIYVIDFDKAAYYHGSKEKLARIYLERWQRAVRKHGISEALVEPLATRLGIAKE
jgi:RIO-like serine/threonine protein kinase